MYSLIKNNRVICHFRADELPTPDIIALHRMGYKFEAVPCGR